MGSKSPEGHHSDHDVSQHKATKSVTPAKPAGGSTFVQDDLGGDDDDEDDDENATADGLNTVVETGVFLVLNPHAVPSLLIPKIPEIDTDETVFDLQEKKKKRRTKKKKKTKHHGVSGQIQSKPPRVVLSELYPTAEYPKGEIHPYAVHEDNTARTTGEEKRHVARLDGMDDSFLSDYRQAAEAHRQVRQWIQQTVKPGHTMSQIAEEIEEGVRALTGHQGIEPGDSLKAGMGFPTGLCLNNVAAHWTPNPGGKETVLQYEDVLSVDFGVHVNGRIVDSAFTMSFDPVYDNLLASVKDATNTGIREAGIDARMSHIGAAIQEAMESYEVEIKGKVYPVKAVRGLTGHNILRYHIHGDKQIPFVKNSSRQKMEEGEVFAIETFGTTGKGYLKDDAGIYGYGRNEFASTNNLHLSSAKALLKTIDNNFGTIVFCRRYLERLGVKNYLLGMNSLISNGIVEPYAPLSDIKGSYVAQFEHTILLRSDCKEVVSRGDDY